MSVGKTMHDDFEERGGARSDGESNNLSMGTVIMHSAWSKDKLIADPSKDSAAAIKSTVTAPNSSTDPTIN